MSWTVVWGPAANTEFMYAWTAVADSAPLWAAKDAADGKLAADPYTAGRHLSEGLWVIQVPPPHVFYAIDPGRRWVEITDLVYTP